MNVLLVSEGKHELGNEYRSAALAELTRRVVARDMTFTPMKVSDPEFGSHGRSDHGLGGQLFKRAVRCLLYAASHGFDALVFVIDQDDEPERRQHLDRAQDESRGVTGRAFGLAVRTFDAWMIADEQALTTALGQNIQRQPDPEEIRNAKAHCRDLRGDNDISLTDLYASVATNAIIATIEQRCPRGFAPFAARLRRL